jgi:transcription antitermination protein NusB
VPSRRKTREFVLQVLFAADAQHQDPLDAMKFLETHFDCEEEEDLQMERVVKEFAWELVDVVSRDQKAIDNLITKLSENWKLHRISRVDRNILRMAIAEMTNFSGTPGRVVLDEAIEIGKKYGAENSSAFINGILDRIHSLLNKPDAVISLKEMTAALDESDSKD